MSTWFRTSAHLWLGLNLCALVLTLPELARAQCDVSALRSSPITIYFMESRNGSYTDPISGGYQSGSVSDHAEGSVTLTYDPASGGRGFDAWTAQYNAPATGTGSITLTGTTFQSFPNGRTFTLSGSAIGSGNLVWNPTSMATLSINQLPFTTGLLTVPACSFFLALNFSLPVTVTSNNNGVIGTYNSSLDLGESCDNYGFNAGGWYGPLSLSGGQLSGSMSCPINLSNQSGSGSISVSWSTAPLSKASVQITSVKISQGQPLDDGTAGQWFGATSVPVLLNRSAVVQLKGTSSGSVPNTLKVDLTLGNQMVTQQIDLSDLKGANGAFVSFIPSGSPGTNPLGVSIEPVQGVQITNPQKPLPATEYASRPIKYLFIDASVQNFIVSNFPKMADLSNQYLESVFPLDSAYTTEAFSSYSSLNLCNVLAIAKTSISLLCDLAFMARQENAERAIGIVGSNFLPSDLGEFVEGLSWSPNIKRAVLVGEGFPQNAAHELGHTYALYDNGELYDGDLYPGACAGVRGSYQDGFSENAYWLSQNQLVTDANYMCDNGAFSNTGAVPDQFYQSNGNTPSLWGTTNDWAAVVGKLSGQPDPEILTIGGYVDSAGGVTLGALYSNPLGTEDVTVGGTYTIQVLGGDGAVLSSTTFTPIFHVDGATVTLPYSPFVFSVAYPPSAVTIQVIKGTSVLATKNIASGLLLTAIQNLQDAAFVANPTERRNALINKTNGFNDQLTTGNATGAYQNLTNDMAKQLSSWLSDSYVAPNPLLYTKSSLLSLVNELAQRLSAPE